MILYATQKVLGETSLVQSLNQLQSDLQGIVGRKIAEGIEGKKLSEDVDLDAWRLGGGSLMASILIGMATPSLDKAGGRAIEVLKKKPSEILGGPLKDTTKPKNDGFDSHHCPAKGCYDGAPISTKAGPAIKMTPADHARTASHGNSAKAVAYREKQEELLRQGKLMEAIDMDIRDIRSKFGDKYDGAIKQMLDYASKLNPDDFKR